jgi:hypothetical protein
VELNPELKRCEASSALIRFEDSSKVLMSSGMSELKLDHLSCPSRRGEDLGGLGGRRAFGGRVGAAGLGISGVSGLAGESEETSLSNGGFPVKRT